MKRVKYVIDGIRFDTDFDNIKRDNNGFEFYNNGLLVAFLPYSIGFSIIDLKDPDTTIVRNK